MGDQSRPQRYAADSRGSSPVTFLPASNGNGSLILLDSTNWSNPANSSPSCAIRALRPPAYLPRTRSRRRPKRCGRIRKHCENERRFSKHNMKLRGKREVRSRALVGNRGRRLRRYGRGLAGNDNDSLLQYATFFSGLWYLPNLMSGWR